MTRRLSTSRTATFASHASHASHASLAAAALAVGACGTGALPESSLDVAQARTSIATSPDIVRTSVVGVRLPSGVSCTGVLVSATRVLTAKHCLASSANGPDYVVQFGVDLTTAAKVRATGAVRVHASADLATLDLPPKALPLGYAPAALNLSGQGDLRGGTTRVVLAGYGATQMTTQGATSGGGRYLRWGKTVFESFMGSYVASGASYSSGLLFVSPISVTSTDPANSAACPGDSGGPIFQTQNRAWGLTALISAGSCSAQNGRLYTMAADVRETAVRTWILN